MVCSSSFRCSSTYFAHPSVLHFYSLYRIVSVEGCAVKWCLWSGLASPALSCTKYLHRLSSVSSPSQGITYPVNMPRIQATAFGKSLGLALSTSMPQLQPLPTPTSPAAPPPAFVFFPTATPMPIPEALQKVLSPELRNSRYSTRLFVIRPLGQLYLTSLSHRW
jgi:hypothetical protein